jgi:isopentenyldiphosphate isomerase
MADTEEIFEVVDISGKIVGTAARSELHGNPSLIHRVVHVLVFDQDNRLLLQKRSMTKDAAPGKWDTSVGGHVNIGENLFAAARRETMEELGIDNCNLIFLYTHIFSNHIESELVATFTCTCEETFKINTEEIDEVRYWEMHSINKYMGTGIFSHHFEKEFQTYLAYCRGNTS